MLIDSIILVKTPLDNEYKNVYKFELISVYIDFLLGFPNETIMPYLVKSVKSDNTSFNCVLLKSLTQLKDYNYAIINSNNTYYYYFVTNFESLNDSEENPSCRIFLEKDVFANYMTILRSENTPNKILQCHIDDTMLDSREEHVVCKNSLTTDNALPVVRNIVYNNRILWLKITTGREIEASLIGIPDLPFDTYANYRGCGDNPLSAQIKVFYVPFIASNAKFAYIEYKNENMEDSVYLRVRTMRDSRDEIYGILTSSDELLSIELTYYAPFSYHYGNVNGEWSVIFPFSNMIENNKLLFAYFYSETDSNRTLLYEQNIFEPISPLINDNKVIFLCATQRFSLNKESFNLNIFLRNALPDTISNIDGYNISIENYSLYEPRLYEYPYKYKSLLYNNEFHDIVPESNASTYKVEIDYYNKPHALLKSYFDVFDEVPNIKYERLNRNGELQLVADSKEYYLRNNGASIGANNINAIGKSIRKKDPSVGLETLISSVASIIDADNAKDIYTEPSINALDDLIYQDGVFAVNVNAYKNTYFYNQIGESFRYYGVNWNRFGKLIEDVRTDFRYIRTEDCSIPSVKNIEDRKKLESIFNRGLTIWNIRNPTSPLDERPSARTLDKSGYNLPITMYKYYKGV